MIKILKEKEAIQIERAQMRLKVTVPGKKFLKDYPQTHIKNTVRVDSILWSNICYRERSKKGQGEDQSLGY